MTQAAGYPLHVAANGNFTPQGKFLMSVSINTKGAGGNTLTIYDGISAAGTLIASVDTTAAIGTILYDYVSITGIFLVLATGTPADLTVSSY